MTSSEHSHHSLSIDTLGVGTDLVHVPTFAAQLEQPGTRFSAVFTDRERASAQERAGGPYASLAGRWAVKESVIKAWSGAQWGEAPVLDPTQVDWSDIEVITDRWRRPQIRLRGAIHHLVSTLVIDLAGPGAEPRWLVSISHDGDYAVAFVTLQAVNSGG